MAEDPLAEVIAAVVDDDMWENRHRPLFAQRTAAAVRAHIAASMEEMDKAVRCLALELDAPVWDHVNGVYSNLRAALLGTRYAPGAPIPSPDPVEGDSGTVGGQSGGDT